jgi:hypothetical protein
LVSTTNQYFLHQLSYFSPKATTLRKKKKPHSLKEPILQHKTITFEGQNRHFYIKKKLLFFISTLNILKKNTNIITKNDLNQPKT